MKIVPNWQNKNVRCYFCGETRSVKYTVCIEEYDYHDTVYCCNQCALRFQKKYTEGEHNGN